MDDVKIGRTITYYGYPIWREGESEYVITIATDDMATAKWLIRKMMELDLIDTPKQAKKREAKEVM